MYLSERASESENKCRALFCPLGIDWIIAGGERLLCQRREEMSLQGGWGGVILNKGESTRTHELIKNNDVHG